MYIETNNKLNFGGRKMNNYDERMRRLARAEERTACKQIGNDKERIQKRIDYLRRHLEELQNILETEDFRS